MRAKLGIETERMVVTEQSDTFPKSAITRNHLKKKLWKLEVLPWRYE
jgi:hypothetical protein